MLYHTDHGRLEWRRLIARYTGVRVGVKDGPARPTGGQGLIGAWRPAVPDPAPLPLGAGFATADRIGVQLPRAALGFARHAFAGSAPIAPNPGFPQGGFWWNRDEPGRGFAIEVQGDRLLVVAYFFDADGRPSWLASTGVLASATRYGGRWQRAIGGPTLGDSLRKFAPTTTDAGPPRDRLRDSAPRHADAAGRPAAADRAAALGAARPTAPIASRPHRAARRC